MRRRGFIVGTVWGLGVAASGTARALGADAALYLAPQGRAQLLRYFTPAGGPLERHAARPGAWYALLYLPMAPQWPMELLLWPAQRRHEMLLFALDAAPDEAPTVVHPLPLALESERSGRPTLWVSRFMLPASSSASAIFVLIEQWRIVGDEPAPLWVQWRAQPATPRTATPWWDAQASREAGATPPPSPLTQELRGPRAHEVPIFGPPTWPEPGARR